MIEKRIAFLLTGNKTSERTLFSKNVLENIGFEVHMILYLAHENKVISNKISMQLIYQTIAENPSNNDNTFGYIFEDDINVLESITLSEIVKYEQVSERFFYLGICQYDQTNSVPTGIKLNDHIVYQVSGGIRGLHAIGLSKKGAKELLAFSQTSDWEYMDMILEDFSRLYPANVVRYDLCSYIPGHRGIVFQDRQKFPSTI